MGLYGVDRLVCALLGGCALIGLGVLGWQARHPSLSVEREARAAHVATWEDPPTALLATGEPLAPGESRPDGPRERWWDEQLERARRVDVNTAPVAELERLPRVGPGLARRIVAYRQTHGPFGAPEDLRQVKGIGPATYEAIRNDITVE